MKLYLHDASFLLKLFASLLFLAIVGVLLVGGGLLWQRLIDWFFKATCPHAHYSIVGDDVTRAKPVQIHCSDCQRTLWVDADYMPDEVLS